MPMQRDAGSATNHLAWSEDFARDFQNAYGHHPSDISRTPQPPQHRAPQRAAANVFDQMTSDMQASLADIERRHHSELRDMQHRIERMTGQAGRARPEIPAELAQAFSRIEQGMAHLAGRIAEAAPERRRANERFVFGAAKPEATHFVFNAKPQVAVAPVVLEPHGSRDPWDDEHVAALVDLYESGAAGYGQPDQATLMAQASARAIATAAAVADPRAEDRSWLEERLSGLGQTVSKSIEAAKPSAALTTLIDRVDLLESRFSATLGSLATKSDFDALRAAAEKPSTLPDSLASLEAQIGDIATHVDSTYKQLARLDVIERHLSELQAFAQASIDAADDAEVFEPTTPAPTAAEIAALAEQAIERALAKMPAPVVQSAHAVADPEFALARAETEKRIEAVHGLLKEFASERRKGDQYTAGMLETVQEALISLIDRVDQIEARKSAPLPAGAAQLAASFETAVDAKPSEQTEQAKPAPRRRVETVTAPDPAAKAHAGASSKALSQQQVDISEIQIKPRRPAIAAAPPEPVEEEAPAAADEPAQEAPATPKVDRRKIRQVTSEIPAPEVVAAVAPAAASGTKKRLLLVAGAAVGLLAVIMLASIFLADRFGPAQMTAPARPSPANAPPLTQDGQRQVVPRLTKQPGAEAPTPARPGQNSGQNSGQNLGQNSGQAAPGSPPGMVGTPLRSAPTSNAAANEASGQPLKTTPDRSSYAPLQGNSVEDLNEQMRPRKPASVPETVDDDLSFLDNDQSSSDMIVTAAEQAASAAAQAQPAPRRSANGPAVPGANIDRGPVVMQVDPRSNQQQATNRYNSTATSPIVTGSNPAVRQQITPATAQPQQPAQQAGERIEMPPALVGPTSLRQAAANGDPSAAFEVATRLAEGRGIKQDFQQAHLWYQRSAAKGFAVAQYRIGTLYERGLGVPADPARAKVWYKRAADQGNVKAMHNMAVLTAGSGGNAPDYEGAAKWFRAAADHGLADSQYNLGVLNEGGLGVTRDLRAAYYWFSLAARSGDAEATKRRDAVMSQLDVGLLQATDEQVRAWRTKPSDPKINDARLAGDLWRQAASSNGGGEQFQQPPQQVPGLPRVSPLPPQPPTLIKNQAQPGAQLGAQPRAQPAAQPAAQAADAPVGIQVIPR